MSNYIFYDVQRFKTEAAITGAFNHNERQKEAYLSNVNIRKEYTDRNYHLKRPDYSYLEYINRRLKQSCIKASKNSILMIDGVISPSPDWINSKSIDEQVEVFFRAYEFVVMRFSYENIISAVVHMDEDNPHMHFDVVPVTPDDRICASDFYPYPDGGSIEQSMFYEHMHMYFDDISRGMPRIFTQRDHVTMKLFKAAPDYFNMHEKMQEAIEAIDRSKTGMTKRKREAMSLYTAISKMAAYTIVMQDGEINYYKNKLIPYFERKIENLNKEIQKNSNITSTDSLIPAIIEERKEADKYGEIGNKNTEILNAHRAMTTHKDNRI